MLEVINFNEEQTQQIMKYYRILVFLFQDCLVEAKTYLDKDSGKFSDKFTEIIGNIEEIEYLDEFEIIAEKFNNLLEKIKYAALKNIKDNEIIVDFFANYYLLVQASAIKNIILFALQESWDNVVKNEKVLSLDDIVEIFKSFIKSTQAEVLATNKKDKIFKGDDLFYLKSLDVDNLEIDEIINISEAIIDNCDGENAYCDYNKIGNVINDLANPQHTIYQEYVNKILAINIYAICIKELKLSKN